MTVTETATYADIPVDQIRANPGQPRTLFDPAKLTELADSIKANGLLQPIVVRPDTDGADVWIIVAGERRWRATQEAGIMSIHCRTLDTTDDDTAFVLSVVENVNRADMTVSEEAKAFGRLAATGRSNQVIGELFGKSADYVSWRRGLLGIQEQYMKLVDQGVIGTNLAYYLGQLSNAGQQIVVGKVTRGEFRTASDAAAFAQAVGESERQEFFMEVQDMIDRTPAPVKAPSSAATAITAAVDALTLKLDKAVPAGSKAADLADLLGDDADAILAALDGLADTFTRARRVLRKTAATVEVHKAAK